MKAAQDAGVAMERAKFIVQDALGTLRIVGPRWRPRASRRPDAVAPERPAAACDGSVDFASGRRSRGAGGPRLALLATAAYPPEAVAAALTAITVLEQLERARAGPEGGDAGDGEPRPGHARPAPDGARPLRAQMRAVLRRHPECVTPLGF